MSRIRIQICISPSGSGSASKFYNMAYRIMFCTRTRTVSMFLVFLKQTVEFNCPPCRACCFASVFLKQTVQFNRLFQRGRGITASAARILSPNPTLQHLPCLLIQSFFYVYHNHLAGNFVPLLFTITMHCKEFLRIDNFV